MELNHVHSNQAEKRSSCPVEQGLSCRTKAPLATKEIWAIRVGLQIKHCKRDLAMFNLAIDSKLRGCDLVNLRLDDIALGGHVRDRATIVQHKTGRPVQFEITEQTRASLQDWMDSAARGSRAVPLSEPSPQSASCGRAPNTHASCAGRRALAEWVGTSPRGVAPATRTLDPELPS